MQLQGFFKKPKNELEKGGRTPVSAAAEIHAEPGEICPACKNRCRPANCGRITWFAAAGTIFE